MRKTLLIILILSLFACSNDAITDEPVGSDTSGNTDEVIEPFDTSELAGTTVLISVTTEQFKIVEEHLSERRDLYIMWLEEPENDKVFIEVYGDKFDEALEDLNNVIGGESNETDNGTQE